MTPNHNVIITLTPNQVTGYRYNASVAMGHVANVTVNIAAKAQDSMQGVMELQLHYKSDKSFRATGAY